MNSEAPTRVLSHELQTRTSHLKFQDAEFTTLYKDRNMDLNAQPNIRLASDDLNEGHILKARTWALKFLSRELQTQVI